MAQNFSEIANFLWAVADLLRGDYKQADYGKVILPFVLLRRLECVLDATKDDVLKEHAKRKPEGVNLDPFLKRKSKQAFYNVSPFTLPGLTADQKHVRQNLLAYVGDFSDDARDVFERFKFTDRIAELEDKDLLFQLVQKFANIDLHPEVVPNETMGLVFEELIRKFAEASNETAGEHFTPREVIQLIVHCLFAGDDEALSKPGVIRSMYDPIIALPNDLFYNTGIATYIWILDNHKKPSRKGKVQLIDATRMYEKMQKSLGNKRVRINDAQITVQGKEG